MGQSELHGEASAKWWVDMTTVPGKFSSDCFAFLSKREKKLNGSLPSFSAITEPSQMPPSLTQEGCRLIKGPWSLALCAPGPCQNS